MKKFAFGAAVAFVLLAAAMLLAQIPGTLVQQSPTMLHAATNVGYSARSAATITITVPGSQYAYITGIDITNCAGATAVTAAAPTNITTTNIQGSPSFMVGSGATAGLCQPTGSVNFSTPLKSQSAGTNVTFVLPT